MGLPEDLQALQDLHEKGKLTDQEFAGAKGATLQLHTHDSALPWLAAMARIS
jgi:hypothetical protein